MNELEEIYKRIEYLRNNGVKMKEIADWINMAPSVLSALYSSVLPAYLNLQKTKTQEEGPGRSTGFGEQCVEKTPAWQSERNEGALVRPGTRSGNKQHGKYVPETPGKRNAGVCRRSV